MAAYYFVKKKKIFTRRMRRFLGAGMALVGVLVCLYFFFPLFLYQIFFGFSSDIVEIPVPKHEMVGGGFGSLLSQGIANLTINSYDARSWYPTLHVSNNSSVPTYSLSIPSLHIDNATVSTVDYDLARHLIQYAGTAIPGQNGNAIIFGHSTLPQWFDPKNYKTIFATLHTIKSGDNILVKVNGVLYTYKIFSVTITSPEDTNIFSQAYDHSYITIVTCTPPGTIWKRLIVRARLEEVGKPMGMGLSGLALNK
ncbi:MAG: sortase [Candidatus Levyibacteriota bacterium]